MSFLPEARYQHRRNMRNLDLIFWLEIAKRSGFRYHHQALTELRNLRRVIEDDFRSRALAAEGQEFGWFLEPDEAAVAVLEMTSTHPTDGTRIRASAPESLEVLEEMASTYQAASDRISSRLPQQRDFLLSDLSEQVDLKLIYDWLKRISRWRNAQSRVVTIREENGAPAEVEPELGIDQDSEVQAFEAMPCPYGPPQAMLDFHYRPALIKEFASAQRMARALYAWDALHGHGASSQPRAKTLIGACRVMDEDFAPRPEDTASQRVGDPLQTDRKKLREVCDLIDQYGTYDSAFGSKGSGDSQF